MDIESSFERTSTDGPWQIFICAPIPVVSWLRDAGKEKQHKYIHSWFWHPPILILRISAGLDKSDGC